MDTNEPRDHESEAPSITSSPTAAEPPPKPSGGDDEREAAEPDERPRRPVARGDALPREDAPDDDLQRHRAGDHRRDAGVDPRLGDVHQPDAEREQRDPEAAAAESASRRSTRNERRATTRMPRGSPAAARKRVPAVSSGGSVRTASLIPRYVEPQTT